MISSTRNEQVKFVIELKKKARARAESGLFVVEGARMAAELPPERTERIYVSESFARSGAARRLFAEEEAAGGWIRAKREAAGTESRAGQEAAGAWSRAGQAAAGAHCRAGQETAGASGPAVRKAEEAHPPYEIVADHVFAAMSDTQTPQGVLALVRQNRCRLADLLVCRDGQDGRDCRAAHLMILENLQDPGNLGTILRAGEGAGITGVLMSRDTVDIYNPKVVRSTMGSIFRVPFLYADSEEEFLAQLRALKETGVRLYAAHLLGKNAYEDEDYTGDTGFLIGNEGNGLTDGCAAMADAWVRIPMAGRVESLNAAVAASVLMFEAARQRRAAGRKDPAVRMRARS